MAEPWPYRERIVVGSDWWEVIGDDGPTEFGTEQAARRYAALPVMLDLARLVLNSDANGDVDLIPSIVEAARAALKAAGEEP